MWSQVGAAVRDRMRELAMTQADLIRASGISDMTVRPVIYGEAVNSRPATLAKIAMALHWEPDAFDRLLAGDVPVERMNGHPSDADSWDDLKSDLSEADRAAVRAIIDQLRAKHH